MLALPGPAHCYRYDGDFSISGRPVFIHQEGGQGRGTGWTVWDGAPATAKHLKAAAADILAGRCGGGDGAPRSALCSVLELGSGMGLAGLPAAAALGLPTVLTDLPEVLPALRRNVEANPSLAPLVGVAPLDWFQPQASPTLERGGSQANGGSRAGDGSSSQPCSQPSDTLGGSSQAGSRWSDADSSRQPGASQPSRGSQPGSGEPIGGRLVLAADCVWVDPLVQPFARTLRLAAGGPGDRALLAYQSRSSHVDALLFGLLAESLAVAPAPPAPGELPRGAIDLYWLTPRGGGVTRRH